LAHAFRTQIVVTTLLNFQAPPQHIHMVGIWALVLLASPLRHAALRFPTESAAPADHVSTESASSPRPSADSMPEWNDDFMAQMTDENPWTGDIQSNADRSIPHLIPGLTAFDFNWWGKLRNAVEDHTGNIDETETEVLTAQLSRFLTARETEEEKQRVINGQAGRSRSRPLGSSAAKACGASPSLLSWQSDSDGKIHLETSDHPSRLSIPLERTDARFDGGSERFSAFRDKWIYMHGDSTLRQQCQAFVEVVANVSAGHDDFKECMRSGGATCPKGLSYVHVKQPQDWEFRYGGFTMWGKHGRTLSLYIPSLNTTLTCDWKMHIFRKYDRWLLKKRFQLQAPDLYIVSPGMHDCSWDRSREMGPAYHALQAETFFEYLDAFLPDETRLVWLSAQQSANFKPGGGEEHQNCISAVNTAARKLAAERSVTFVDREPLTRNFSTLAETHADMMSSVSQDGLHYTATFNQVVFHYIAEAAQCLMNS